jgi:GAF domain-containing protein
VKSADSLIGRGNCANAESAEFDDSRGSHNPSALSGTANMKPADQEPAPANEEAALRRVAMLVDEQAALRRVAMLVARGTSPVDLFVAVCAEARRILSCDATGLLRFESEGSATLVAQSETPWDPPPIGTQFTLDGENFVTRVFHTGRAARVDDWTDSTGSVAAMATVLGVHSAVGCPVVVEGRLWGTLIAATSTSEPLPDELESRLGQFTELIATAIANAEARDALAKLADEQTALRRVATLVADGVGPEGVFPAVAAEVDTLFGADISAIVRFEEDGAATVLGDVGGPHVSGKRVALDPGYVVDRVRTTHESARFDTDDPTAADMPSLVRSAGIRSAVASPIVVEGEVWGAITAASVEGPLAPGAERHLSEFTELVATAVSNTQSQSAARTAAEEQGALRRVATLVAASAPPSEVFAAVTREIARVLGADACLLCRADDDGVVVVGTWADNAPAAPPGFRIPRGGKNLTTIVLDTGRPGRLDSYDDASGDAADIAHSQGVRSAVGAPILVEGRLWGLVIAGRAGDEQLPPGSEERLAAFTGLVATAIANTESSRALERVAADQAALRRVATLIARQPSPQEIFAAVTEAAGSLLGADVTGIVAVTDDITGTLVAGWSPGAPAVPVGHRVPLDQDGVTARVVQSAAPARIDESGPDASSALAGSLGVSSSVGAPIIVGGKLWGVLGASLCGDDPLPEDAEARLAAFTELVATAIVNAESSQAVERAAAEQAALRRVATLVAVDASQDEIFNAIAVGVAGALGEELRLVRFEREDAVVVAGSEGPHIAVLPVGTRLPVGGNNALSYVFRTGEPVRIDDYSQASGPIAEAVRAQGLRSIVAVPVAVEGRTWGAMIVGTFGEDPVPPGTEGRLAQFAELMATSIANTEARAQIERLAEQEAALRRIATLIAQGVDPEQVFAAVAEATAAIFQAIAIIIRFEHDRPVSVVVGLSREIGIALGSRWPFEEGLTSTEVYRTGRSARLSSFDWASRSGPFSEAALRAGVSSHVSSPIHVEGRLWGAINLSASEELPPDTEQRLERFTELVTTAIANTQSRGDLRRLAEQQAALRRVATLVARRDAPQVIFEAVAAEAGGLLGADIAGLVRFETDDTVTVMAGPPPGPFVSGDRVPLDPAFVVHAVRESGRPERFETDDPADEGMPELVRRFLIRSALASPILVEGELWGAIVLGSVGASFPADTEQRLDEFTELVATGVSNATARADLIASRARIVTAGDEARRRIERNLHDGTQQRLIALGLEIQRLRAEMQADPTSEAAFGRIKLDLESILEDLRELSRGLHPPLLSRVGLEPPLQALALRSEIPVHLDVDLPERPPPPVETAIYYVVSEALANATKYSQASAIRVTLSSDPPDGSSNPTLHGVVADDGVGGAEPGGGSGLIGLVDRVNALGGHLALESPPGRGTRISFDLPLEPPFAL